MNEKQWNLVASWILYEVDCENGGDLSRQITVENLLADYCRQITVLLRELALGRVCRTPHDFD